MPNLLLQKLPAEQFTATTRVTFYNQHEGDQVGLVLWGLDYAALVLTAQSSIHRALLTQRVCMKADRGASEESTEPVPLKAGQLHEVYLRVTVQHGAHCRFSYSVDGGDTFKELGAEFTAREGRWVGAKVGIFAQGGGATPSKDGYAKFGPWVVTP